tara:strand:- start:3852 stop:4112 length:261 start_codon:yes stop_codon:yes gene_type:complete
MRKVFDPEGVELFRMFSLVINEQGHELWHFRPVNNSGEDRTVGLKLEMDTKEGRAARVLELKAAYDVHSPNEVSPFDVDGALSEVL